jgi:hypothetical protein
MLDQKKIGFLLEPKKVHYIVKELFGSKTALQQRGDADARCQAEAVRSFSMLKR